MALDKLNSIADIQALEAEKAKIIQILDDTSASLSNLQKQAGTIELKLGDVKTVTELNAALKELKSTTKEISGLTLDQAKAVKTLAEAEVKLEQANLVTEKTNGQKIKNQKDELALAATLEKGLTKVEAARKREEKQLEELNNDYQILNKAYVDAANKAKMLGAAFGVNSQIFKQASADAKVMYDRLVQIDMAVGQGQRQVGQYNMIAAQFGQVMRELPNAGLSLQTFVIAISNNINGLAESVVNAKAKGESWGQILGSLATRANIMMTAINLAVLAITILSKKLSESGDSAAEATKKIDEYIKKIGELGKKDITFLQEDANLKKTKRELDLLKARGASEEEIYRKTQEYINQEISLIDKQTKAYGDLGTAISLNREKIINAYDNAGKYNKRDRVTEAIGVDYAFMSEEFVEELVNGLKAGVTAWEIFEDDIAKLGEKRLEKENEALVNTATYQRELTDKEKKEYEKRLKDYEQYLKQREELRQALQNASNSFRNGDVDELQGAVNQIMGAGDGANDIIIGGFFKGIMKAKEKAMNDIAREEAAAMIGIENSYAAGLYSWEEYEKAKTDSTLRFADKRTDAEIKALKAELEFLPENGAARIEIEKKINDIELANLKKHNKKKEETDKESAEKRKQIAKKVEEEMQAMYFRLASEISKSSFSIINSSLEKEKMKNEQAYKNIENSLNRKVNLINATYTDEEQRIRDIAGAEAEAQAQREQLDERQRGIARRQAAFQKAAAMAEIVINTAASISAQARKTPLPEGAPLMFALAGIGAAQLAAVAAQPLPQYAEGTTDHMGGKFIAGDGGERELVVRPDGRMYWTDSTPKVYDEPKHTKVLNSDMISSLYATLAPKMLQTLEDKRNKTDKQLADRLEIALNKNTRATVAAIRKNRTRLNVMKGDGYYLTHVKGAA